MTVNDNYNNNQTVVQWGFTVYMLWMNIMEVKMGNPMWGSQVGLKGFEIVESFHENM